jgi:hypothetical protein
MIANVSDARSRLAAVVAALLLLVAFAPTLLLGESVSAFGLIVTGACLTGVGLIARAGRSRARTFGTVVVVLGALVLAVGIGLLVLLLGGLRRGI